MIVAADERALRARWARWGVTAAVVGMLSWVIGVGLIPLDAKLEKGDQVLASTLVSASTRLYFAAMLAVLGAALLVGFFAALTRLVPEGESGSGLLRIALVGCVVAQTIVSVGAAFALVGIHSAVAGESPGFVAFAWRALWLTFLASAVPTILFTTTGILGMVEAGLTQTWVSVLGWISVAAHVVVLFTLGQSGAFAADGIVAALTPVTTVIWILATAAQLPRRVAVTT